MANDVVQEAVDDVRCRLVQTEYEAQRREHQAVHGFGLLGLALAANLALIGLIWRRAGRMMLAQPGGAIELNLFSVTFIAYQACLLYAVWRSLGLVVGRAGAGEQVSIIREYDAAVNESFLAWRKSGGDPDERREILMALQERHASWLRRSNRRRRRAAALVGRLARLGLLIGGVLLLASRYPVGDDGRPLPAGDVLHLPPGPVRDGLTELQRQLP